MTLDISHPINTIINTILFFLKMVVLSDLEIQMEVERLVVCEFAKEQQIQSNQPDILTVQHTSSDSQINGSVEKKQKKKPKIR